MSSLPTIYLVRHGETSWAIAGRHTGRTDVPLTAKGEADARKIGNRMAGISVARTLTSPLQRAVRTAQLAGYTPEPEPDLLEWNYGDCEGLTTAQIRSKSPGWDLFRDGAPGGESVQDIAERADRIVAKLKALTGNILIFAHGHILRVIAARWVQQPVPFGRALLLSTASVSILGFDHLAMDEPAIKLWNDDRHLQ